MSSRIALITLVCVAASGLAMAQTSPSQDTTSPSTSTQNPTKESPTTSSSASHPASASSPHQRQALAKEPSAQQVKDCVAKQRAEDSSVSEKDAKKTCKAQLKEEMNSKNR